MTIDEIIKGLESLNNDNDWDNATTELLCAAAFKLRAAEEIPEGGKWLTREQVSVALDNAGVTLLPSTLDNLFGDEI